MFAVVRRSLSQLILSFIIYVYRLPSRVRYPATQRSPLEEGYKHDVAAAVAVVSYHHWHMSAFSRDALHFVRFAIVSFSGGGVSCVSVGDLDRAWDHAKVGLLYRNPMHRPIDFFYVFECFVPMQVGVPITP